MRLCLGSNQPNSRRKIWKFTQVFLNSKVHGKVICGFILSLRTPSSCWEKRETHTFWALKFTEFTATAKILLGWKEVTEIGKNFQLLRQFCKVLDWEGDVTTMLLFCCESGINYYQNYLFLITAFARVKLSNYPANKWIPPQMWKLKELSYFTESVTAPWNRELCWL